MSEVDWDSKTVIGFKAKAPKVTKNTSDLNGESYPIYLLLPSCKLADPLLAQLCVSSSDQPKRKDC